MKKSSLLGPLYRRVQFLAQLLLTRLDPTDCTVAQLLMDADANPFVLKPRSFDGKDGHDCLYFSLKSPVLTLREQFYYHYCLAQQQSQQCYTHAMYNVVQPFADIEASHYNENDDYEMM
jgi:hypothetical protein